MEVSKLGQVAAQLMDDLANSEEDFDSERVEVGEVMILVEVRGEDSEGNWNHIAWRCTDGRGWVQRGLLHAAIDHGITQHWDIAGDE